MYRYTLKTICHLLDNYLTYKLEPDCSQCYTGVYYKFDPDKDADRNRSDHRKRYVTPDSNNLDSIMDMDNAIDSLGQPGRWYEHISTIETEQPSDGLTPMQKHISNYITGRSSHIYPNIPYILMSRLNLPRSPNNAEGLRHGPTE